MAAARTLSGYLSLLSQLTKVGDYDEATFTGEAAVRLAQSRAAWGQRWRRQPRALLTWPSAVAARLEEMSRLKDTYKVVVIEGARERAAS